MPGALDNPAVFGPLVFLVLLGAGGAGSWIRRRDARAGGKHVDAFKTLEGAVLGLLGLLLGFSFAMAVGHYDNRWQLELDEANAIGTTWLRTDVLDEPVRSASRELLREYVPVRETFFSAGTDQAAVKESLTRASVLQGKLWALAIDPAGGQATPYKALYLNSLNETIDISEKRTAATFEHRVPVAAWVLLIFVAAIGSLLLGIGFNSSSRTALLIMPLVIAATLTLILDIDSPRRGLIKVSQGSMSRLAEQVAPH